jgi:hypothetical protein
VGKVLPLVQAGVEEVGIIPILLDMFLKEVPILVEMGHTSIVVMVLFLQKVVLQTPVVVVVDAVTNTLAVAMEVMVVVE